MPETTGAYKGKVNVLPGIKYLSNLGKHCLEWVVEVVVVGMLPLQTMNDRLAIGIGFYAEGFVTVAVCLHLLGIKGLNLSNSPFYLLVHLWTKRPVVG